MQAIREQLMKMDNSMTEIYDALGANDAKIKEAVETAQLFEELREANDEEGARLALGMLLEQIKSFA